MFEKAISKLTQIRRFVDKTHLEHLRDNNFVSVVLDEVVFSLTLAINDLVRADKVIKKENLDNGIQEKIS